MITYVEYSNRYHKTNICLKCDFCDNEVGISIRDILLTRIHQYLLENQIIPTDFLPEGWYYESTKIKCTK